LDSGLQIEKKIYFVSDVHLGAPALKDNKIREALFVRWLNEISPDAAEIYLMGDIFDFWFEYKSVVPRGFTRVLAKLAELTENGIPVHFFTGNHDAWIFDYLPSETGVILHREPLQTELSGKKFFLAHGDGLDAGDKGYLILRKIFTSRTLQRFFSWLHPNIAFSIAHKWSEYGRKSKSIAGDDFRNEEEGIYKFAESVIRNGHVDFFVFGHRHRIADMKVGDRSRMILLGEWIESFSYGIFDGEQFTVNKYQNRNV
jgi:UDP-2,3-diacylglucosamine hydrolase